MTLVQNHLHFKISSNAIITSTAVIFVDVTLWGFFFSLNESEKRADRGFDPLG